MSTLKSKDGGKKSSMDPEVTRVVLIFLLLLVIIALLVAAFMSLGNGMSDSENQNNIIQIEIPTDENGETISTTEPPATTEDPNHNVSPETIPDEILNPSSDEETGTTAELQENTQETEETATTEADTTRITTTGTRPASTNPVYVSTGDSTLATLAPPLTTAGDGSNPTTLTTTVSQEGDAGDGTVTNVNYTVSLTGSAGIYSEPGGSSNGTIGSNGTFTIVQEKTDSSGVKWGKLKSGAGWVRLN